MKAITIWLSVVLSLFSLTACGLTSDGMINSRLNRLNNSQTEDIAEEQVENLLSLANQNNISYSFDREDLVQEILRLKPNADMKMLKSLQTLFKWKWK